MRVAFNGFGGIAPIYLGQDAGIFKKQNLNLEMIFIPGGSLSLQALIGKSLEYTHDRRTAGGECVFAGRQDQNHRRRDEFVAVHFYCDGGIRNPEQLKGKKIGISRFGSNTDYVVRLAFNQFALGGQRRAGHPGRRIAGAPGGDEVRERSKRRC